MRDWSREATAWRVQRGLALVADAPSRLAEAGGVALSFDDGPHPEATPAVLDALAAAGATATFFCTGANVQRRPDLVHRIVAEGHAVGSHGHLHLRGSLGDHRRGARVLEQVLGRRVALFRPPHGHLTPLSAPALRASGRRTWLWDVDPADWAPGAEAEKVVADVTAALRPGAVVVLHDALLDPMPGADPDRTATVAALPGILRAVQEAGLRTVALT